MTKPSKSPYDSWNSRPYKTPPIESILIKTAYAITFNPSEQNISVLRMKSLYQCRLRALPDINLKMYPEFAKKSLRLHYHGVIRFSSMRGIMCFYVWLEHHQKNMTYELDTMTDGAIWDMYTSKQKQQFLSVYKPEQINLIYERSNPGLTKAMIKLLAKSDDSA